MTRQLVVWCSLAATGCLFDRDSDDDGLKDSEEEALGLDPNLADTDGDGLDDGAESANGADPLKSDTDGDGLNDGDEVANGADPQKIDTDEDGYTDRDEVFEGKDPADPESVIYKGGWPYYFAKDELKGGGLANTAEMGKRFARLQMKDQFGDTVDLFDFYNADKPVVIDLSAEWCPPCNAVSAWLDGGADDYYSGFWAAGPAVIERGDVIWITILGEDSDGNTATKPVATRWYNSYPSSHIPVLADNNYTSATYVELEFWPTVMLLTPDLKLATNDGYVESVLSELALQFPE